MDAEYSSHFSSSSKSQSYLINITCVFTIWLTFFPYTAHGEAVTSDNNRTSRFKENVINPQKCNSDIHTASHVSDNQKQNKRSEKASPVERIKETFKCLASVDNVYEEWNRNKNLLIDIRRAKAFSKNNIPGSMNLPLYILKYKEDFKKRNIVLVDKGLQLSTLEKSCLELKAKGFDKISFMHDGLKAWGEAGYPVSGNKLALQGLSDVAPSEFVSVINEREWVFIDIDHSSKELLNLLSPSSVIEYTEDYESLKGRIGTFKAGLKPGVIPGILVISQDGNSNRIIKERFLDFAIKDIYYLKGGVSGLKQFMQKHAAQVERLRKGFQVRMGCNG
jgi:rhodanese-related sulfurtransferase